jgi:hypothetical protein
LQKIQKQEEGKKYLFWYTNFTLIFNKQYSILTEKEAKNKLTQYSSKEMDVYYCKFPETTTPLPDVLKNKKGLITESVTSHKEVSELIYEKTGVSVPESELRSKTKDQRPLGERAMAFVKQANEAEAKEKRVQEIYQCLLENDKKRRLECLKNCKI